MTIASDVRSILVESIESLPGVVAANIHTYRIPPDDWTDDKPVFLITEIVDNEVGYGNNNPTRLAQQVQIQIYYPLQYTADISQLHLQLKSVMREAGYRCYSGTGLFDTPDEQNQMATLKFNHTKELI